MFHGYNWQTRTLEVRPDRIAQDFDGPNPTLTSPGSFHSPGNSIISLVIQYHTPDRRSQGLCTPVSHPTLSPQFPQTLRTFWVRRDQRLLRPVKICL